MSSNAVAARAIPRPVTRTDVAPGGRQRPAPPRLRVVAPAPAQSRVGLALLSITLLAGGLVTLLLLNISLSRGSYELSAAQQEQRRLNEERQALREQIEAVQAPQALARKARALGMVPSPRTAFLDPETGKVLGKPAEATAPPRPANGDPAARR